MTLKPMPIFDHAHPTTITLSFLEFVSANKKSVYSINSFLSYSQFKSPMTRMATHIFPHNHPNIFQSTFNFHESVSYAKKQAISSFCSMNISDLRSCNPIGLEHFGPYLRNQIFLICGICAGK